MSYRRHLMKSTKKNPYVSNGLIAMYDGIWNKDFNKHSVDTTTWTDLSGNNRDIILTKAAWDANSMYIPISDTDNIEASIPGFDYKSIEFVIQIDWTIVNDYDEAVIFFNNVAYGLAIQAHEDYFNIYFTTGVGGYSNIRISTNYWGWKTRGDIITIQIVRSETSDPNDWKAIVDGISRTVWASNATIGVNNGINTRSDRKFGGHIYAIRCYNRALSDIEFAKNRAIDKKRFNIEDTFNYDSELEYLSTIDIEAGNTLRINSRVVAADDVDFEIKFSYPSIYTRNQGSNMGSILGYRKAWNQNLYQLSSYNKNNNSVGHFAYYNQGWSNASTPVAAIDAPNVMTINKIGKVFTAADGTKTTLPSNTFNGSFIAIFGLNQAGTFIEPAIYLRIHSLKFYKNGTIIRDYVPIRRNGIGYLLDKLTNRRYGKQYYTSDDFILGPDKTT